MANQIIVESGTGNITVTTSRSVIGTVANVASANYANFAGQVTNANQPNITNVGNLTTLTVAGTATVNDLTVLGNLSVGNLVANNANYANFAGVAYSVAGANVSGTVANAAYATNSGTAAVAYNVSGSNVSGAVANATYADSANIANTAYAVSGANVSGSVANANYSNFAGTAYSVSGSNVTGSVANANYAANAGNANIANTAYSVSVGNVSGIGNIATINLDGNASNVLFGNGTFGPEGTTGNANYANFAGTAYSVSGSNVSGAVANATYADNAGNANIANTAYAVSGANVSGTVANATYADNAGNANIANTAYAVSGANVSGAVANANYANFAGDVVNSTQSNITSLGTLTGLTMGGNIVANANITYDIGNSTNRFKDIWLANSTIYIGNANVKADDGNNTINLSVTGASNALVVGNSNITASNNFVAVGNITGQANVSVDDTLILSDTVQITSPGYYLPYGFTYNGGEPNNNVIFTLVVNGDVTNGSNTMTNVTISTNNTGTPLTLANYASYMSNLTLMPTLNFDTGYINANLPILGTISNVDTSNSTITYSNNFTGSNNITVRTGVMLYDTAKDAYFGATRYVLGQGLATYASNNQIVMDTVDPIDFDIGPGAPIKFIGTTFGGITANTEYYVDSVDQGNVAITISDTQFGPTKTLTNGSGTMMVIDNGSSSVRGQTIRSSYNTFFAGPFTDIPVYANLTTSTNIGYATTPNLTFNYSKSVNYNNNNPSEIPQGFIANIQYNQLVGPTVVGTLAAPTITGEIYDSFGINGVLAVNSGTDANLTGLRTSLSTLSFTDGGSDSASVTNPGNPPGITMTTYTGNAIADINERYLRSGRTIGRIAWYGAQKINGSYTTTPGSSPQAGIYVQALGNWDSSVNTSLPMVMAFQYSPLNATPSGATNYNRINRTFLQAANNTTTIGGATNIEFRPLARSNNGTNNRSPSALGNVSINPQQFANISGYTAGNAVSNGAGALLNVTTTASTWNGDVAVRLSRTVGNTANMEFKLPVNSANTMLLVDNASGNTIATFTNGNISVTGNISATNANLGNLATANYFSGDGSLLTNISSNAISATYGAFYNPNDIAITANTVANLDLPNVSANSGVTIASNNQITISKAGTYNLQLSLQLKNTDNAADHDFDFWFAKNGNDIAYSATQITVVKNDGKNIAVVNFIDQCAANDYYQIRYAASSANISLEAFGNITTPYTRPAIPSAIVTVVPVGS